MVSVTPRIDCDRRRRLDFLLAYASPDMLSVKADNFNELIVRTFCLYPQSAHGMVSTLIVVEVMSATFQPPSHRARECCIGSVTKLYSSIQPSWMTCERIQNGQRSMTCCHLQPPLANSGFRSNCSSVVGCGRRWRCKSCSVLLQFTCSAFRRTRAGTNHGLGMRCGLKNSMPNTFLS